MNRRIIQKLLPLEPGASERPVRTKRPSRREAGVKPNSDELVFVPAKLIQGIGDFDGSDLKVYLCLRAAAGRNEVTGLTIEAMAKATKLCTRMVLKALKWLEAGGWISRTTRPGQLSNRYSFR
jgi:hypothetical protein